MRRSTHLILSICIIAAAVLMFVLMNTVSKISDAEQTIAALKARAAELEWEIALLKSREDVERLQNVYGYYFDKHLWREAADLFTSNARYESAQSGVFETRERILKVLETLGERGVQRGRLDNHIQLQPVIHVAPDGNSARARSRELIQTGTYSGDGYWGEGVYENIFAKENGMWKISSLHFYPTVYTPYEQGWGEAATNANPFASPKIESDLTPTEIFSSYPEVYIPPFHYNNPVSGRTGTGLSENDLGVVQ